MSHQENYSMNDNFNEDTHSSISAMIELLTEIPPLWEKARESLDALCLPSETLSYIAWEVVEPCFFEYDDLPGNDNYENPGDNENINHELFHSFYLYDVFELLLEYGMNPNGIITIDNHEENIISKIGLSGNGNVAARCTRLLMEHGGNPNLEVDDDVIFLEDIADLTFDIDFGYYNLRYYRKHFRAKFQRWLVLLAYGGVLENGNAPVKMQNGYSVEIFKEFERFRWEVEPHEPTPEQPDTWFLHIFDIKTGEKVAIL